MNKLVVTAIALCLGFGSVAVQAQGAGKKVDPYTQGAKSGKPDPYTDGAKAGEKFDPYTQGANKNTAANLNDASAPAASAPAAKKSHKKHKKNKKAASEAAAS